MKLTIEHINAWAIENGFEFDPTDGRLKAPYGDGHVIIENLSRDVRTVIEHGEHRRVLAKATPSKTHIDEHGMLQGVGLFSFFRVRYLDDIEAGREPEIPVWFGPTLRSALAEADGIEPQTRRAAPRP